MLNSFPKIVADFILPVHFRLLHECYFLSDDDPYFLRFIKIIQKWIQEEEVPNFDRFSKETKRKKDARKRKVNRLHIVLEENFHLL